MHAHTCLTSLMSQILERRKKYFLSARRVLYLDSFYLCLYVKSLREGMEKSLVLKKILMCSFLGLNLSFGAEINP